jgi:hypothetical protein
MDDPPIPLADDAHALLSAAERLQQAAGDRASAPFVPAALGRIEQSLLALSRGCDRAAQCFVPPADRDASISLRYARAAADWPGAGDRAGPSYERQAQVLASLHDAAAALRAAADCCVRARELLSTTMEAPADPAGLDHRSVVAANSTPHRISRPAGSGHAVPTASRFLEHPMRHEGK